MKTSLIFYLVAIAGLSMQVLSAQNSTTSAKPAPTSAKPAPTSAKPAPTSAKPAPTSAKPAPTSAKPAPTSAKPAPTSAKPVPTSVKPTPTSVHPSKSTAMKPSHSKVVSTSIAPSKHSSVMPVSSSKPPTKPPVTTTTPKPIHYDVTAVLQNTTTKKECLWFDFNANVTYKINGMNETTTVKLANKAMMTPTGKCSDLSNPGDTSMIEMQWPDHTLTAVFKAKKDKNWIVEKLHFTVDIKTQNLGATTNTTTYTAEKTFGDDENTDYLRGQQNYAYSCTTPDQVTLDSKNGSFSIIFQEIKIQPFSNGGNLTSKANTCSSKSKSSTSSSIVPIAVGCALAGLIVIVLIAYLIGRRKSEGRGYQQV